MVTPDASGASHVGVDDSSDLSENVEVWQRHEFGLLAQEAFIVDIDGLGELHAQAANNTMAITPALRVPIDIYPA